MLSRSRSDLIQRLRAAWADGPRPKGVSHGAPSLSSLLGGFARRHLPTSSDAQTANRCECGERMERGVSDGARVQIRKPQATGTRACALLSNRPPDTHDCSSAPGRTSYRRGCLSGCTACRALRFCALSQSDHAGASLCRLARPASPARRECSLHGGCLHRTQQGSVEDANAHVGTPLR